MNHTNKLLLVLFVVQVGLVAVLRGGDDVRPLGEATPLFAGFDKDAVSELELWNSSASEPALTFKRADTGWVLGNFANYPVDEGKISAGLSALSGAVSRRAIATGKERFGQLGVDADSFERKVVLRVGGGEEKILYIGKEAGKGKTAVRVEGSEEIHALASIRSTTFTDEVASWVDANYFQTDKSKISALSVSNAKGMFDLKKEQESWSLTVEDKPFVIPSEKALSLSAVNGLIGELSAIRLVKPVNQTKIESVPVVTVIIQTSDDASNTFTLDIYEEADSHILHERNNEFYVEVNKAGLGKVLDATTDSLLEDRVAKEPTQVLPNTGNPISNVVKTPKPKKGAVPKK